MCPEMVVAPAGDFVLGSPGEEPGRARDEGPQRRVRIDYRIAVSRFEVTRAEYLAFVAATGHPIGGNCITDRVQRGNWVADAATDLLDPGYRQGDDHPVVCVNLHDAETYIAWLNRQTAGGYRLLTEAEWEYVARAGSTTAYPWGPDVDAGCPFMNGTDRTFRARYPEPAILPAGESAQCDDSALRTAPVGSYLPNGFGLYDMIGNVATWTADCSTADYSGMGSNGVPAAGECARRMVRGGSFGTYARQLRSAERIRYAPEVRDDSIGIRVAKTID